MQRLLALIPVALLGACAVSPTPQYDMRFGEAVNQAKQQMTANPNPAPVQAAIGMDGKAAAEAHGRYQDSFKAPPPVVNVINIGGSVGGGN
ncbi:hypothetical protein GCM10027034_12790 [Ramlibacter solisilvae]|uniref:Lipoprotein n=1 Tax=Ramlibacter tataouinensis TaxID=94132 RepID=A0A127K0Q1_9BURK|nr:hypothetical protein [Ramlibacter tataouinensis]AMO24452.1 hypothetical protein UC35_18435 [Ramlibacter tataouinensis]